MEMHNIEQLTKEYKAAYDELADRTLELQADIDALKRKRLRGIKSSMARVAESLNKLREAIKASPKLFKKPRSTVFYGVRVGMKKGKGKLRFDDEEKVIALIKKHLPPDLAETVIKQTESLVKKAVEQLPAETLKKIACRLEDTGDQALIKVADSDIDKMLDALLKDWDEEAIEEAAA
jgi:hypothetical protein